MSNKRIIKIIKDNKEFNMEVNQNMSVDEFKQKFLSTHEQNIQDYELYYTDEERINSNLNKLNDICLKKKKEENSSKNSSQDTNNKICDPQNMCNNNDSENQNLQNNNEIKVLQTTETPGKIHNDEKQEIGKDENTPNGDKINVETTQTSTNPSNIKKDAKKNKLKINEDELKSEKYDVKYENNGSKNETNEKLDKKENKNQFLNNNNEKKSNKKKKRRKQRNRNK